MNRYSKTFKRGEVTRLSLSTVYTTGCFVQKALAPLYGQSGFDTLILHLVFADEIVRVPFQEFGTFPLPQKTVQSFSYTGHIYLSPFGNYRLPRKTLSVNLKTGYKATQLLVHGSNLTEVEEVFEKLQSFLLCVTREIKGFSC